MIELSLNNVSKFFGASKVFENISFELKTNERIGLIGQNGCGKTTLMKMILGVSDYQGGNIGIRKGARVGYLDQIFQNNFEKPEEVTVLDVLQLAYTEIYVIKKQMEALEIEMSTANDANLEKVMKRYGQLQEQFDLMKGYEVETQIGKIMQGLEITESMQKIPFESLSGGEKTRVILAKLLLEEPDILLLDEPSNHLDIQSIEWLEGFLKEYKGSVLMISHDRYFLDCVVTKIIELQDNQAVAYEGNYSYYVVEKERRFLIAMKDYQNQQRKIENMERQIERYRIWGAMRDSDKMYRRAKELEKRLEKIEVVDRPVFENRKMKLSASMESRSGKAVLEIRDLSKSFEQKVILSHLDLNLFYQDSACLMGDNGSGKTTLLKMILGEITYDNGSIKLGASLKIGYLPQNVVFENEEMTLLEYFSMKHNIAQGEARGYLAKALFMKDAVHKKIKSLSGGEKSRLKLCSLTFDQVNFMILDEPTNHLDIDSREILEEVLMEFAGTILFVSHDRYFVQKIADRMMVLEDSTVKTYPFEYAAFLEERKKEEIALLKGAEEKLISQQKTVVESVIQKNSVQNTRKPIQKPEASKKNVMKIGLLEKEIEALEIKLSDNSIEIDHNSHDNEKLLVLLEERLNFEMQLEITMAEWDRLQEV